MRETYRCISPRTQAISATEVRSTKLAISSSPTATGAALAAAEPISMSLRVIIIRSCSGSGEKCLEERAEASGMISTTC